MMEERKKLKILLLEDNHDDVALIERELSRNDLPFENECVDTREEFNAALLRFNPDVVLSDHGLPGFNSREALSICRREKMTMPFILVTGTISDENAIECLSNGADDFVLKSNLSRLPAVIRTALRKRKVDQFKSDAGRVLRQQNEALIKSRSEILGFITKAVGKLRGPNESMHALIEAARNENVNHRVTSILDMLQRCVSGNERMFKSIDDVAKWTANKSSISRISWSDQMDRVATEMKLEFPGATTNFNLTTDAAFFSDSESVAFIIKTLVNNACTYSKKSYDPEIEIQVMTTSEEATITVRDQGCGIGEEVLPKVYDMFFRGNEKIPGTGMGLYIVKQIVTALHGSIQLQSEIGKGTSAIVVIPNVLTGFH